MMPESDGMAKERLNYHGGYEDEEEEPPVHTPIGIIHIDPISVTGSSHDAAAAAPSGGGIGAFRGAGGIIGSATSMTSIAEDCLVGGGRGFGTTVTSSSLESFVHARARESSDKLGPTSPMSGAGAASGGDGASSSPQHLQHSVHFEEREGQYQHRRNHDQQIHHQRTTSSGSMHKVASINSHSSSSSSLTSMAAALALGGPTQVIYMQQKLQGSSSTGMQHYQLNNTSPITPLNMLGLSPSGHEMMMLPPPPRFPNGATTTNGNGGGGLNGTASPIQPDCAIHGQHPSIITGQPHHSTILQQTTSQHHLAASNALPSYSSQATQHHRHHPQPMSEQPNNFLPQMHQTAGVLMASRQQQQPYAQSSDQTRHLGFPDSKSIMSAMLSTQQQQQHQHSTLPIPPLPPRPLSQSLPSQLQSTNGGTWQSPSQLPPPPHHLPATAAAATAATTTTQQIQIGLSGQTIPITAISGEDGSVQYQIDPSVLPNGVLPTTSGLRYFTKAINEVSRPDAQKEIDPEVLAEKRRQRLARNRESARQSRRRKKELLVTLSTKVRKLQSQLEKEVRSKISSMERELSCSRKSLIDGWLSEQQQQQQQHENHDRSTNIDWEFRNTLARILHTVGINCEIRRTVIAHQYHFLRQSFLPPHNHFSIWMMIQSSKFFTEACRRQQNELALSKASSIAAAVSTPTTGSTGNGALASKTHSSRANSRQIGETMYNEESAKQHASGDASYSDENSTQFGGDASYIEDSKRGQQYYVACSATDEGKMWPLFCHEIGVTMEQEDRVVNCVHAQ